ncbi:MAG: 50S ribosomal protein L29 [Coriobacteriia bacterium]|nr:50S ribosomal protein L29 [Coriobacteriia bacterium]
MKAKEIHTLGDSDLEKELANAREELFNLRFRLATGQVDDTSKISQVKRTIARLLTEIRMREITAANAKSTEEAPVHG